MKREKEWLGRLMLCCGLLLTQVGLASAQATESLLARARRYEPQFVQAGQRYGVDPRLLWVVAYLESRFQPSVISRKGARGLMQFMPETAARYGLRDPHEAASAIDAAARYLRDLLARYGQRVDLALAAYNAGEGAVDAALVKAPSDGIPLYRETRSYVQRGLQMWQRQSAVTARAAISPIDEAREMEREEGTPLALPRGVARQSVFMLTSEPPQLKPINRRSHYFGTRIDNSSAIPRGNAK